MRIIVVSDTHRDFFRLKGIVEDNRSADLFIHLGDGEQELRDVQELFTDKTFLFVRGNCDYASMAKSVDTISVGDYKLLFTHGNNYDVGFTLDSLIREARHNGAQIALYGHTHVHYTGYADGIYVMNPGSPSSPRGGRKPSYGVIDLTPAGVAMHIVEIKH